MDIQSAMVSEWRSRIEALLQLTMGVVLASAMVAGAGAGTSADDDQDTPGAIIKGSDLIGQDVKNAAGENLGEIKDLAIDCDRRAIACAVLSSGVF